jgi:hypothetical protein
VSSRTNTSCQARALRRAPAPLAGHDPKPPGRGVDQDRPSMPISVNVAASSFSAASSKRVRGW